MRIIFFMLCLAGMLCTTPAFASGHHSTSSSHHTKVRAGRKTQKVHGYKTKSGKVVKAYKRRPARRH